MMPLYVVVAEVNIHRAPPLWVEVAHVYVCLLHVLVSHPHLTNQAVLRLRIHPPPPTHAMLMALVALVAIAHGEVGLIRLPNHRPRDSEHL